MYSEHSVCSIVTAEGDSWCGIFDLDHRLEREEVMEALAECEDGQAASEADHRNFARLRRVVESATFSFCVGPVPVWRDGDYLGTLDLAWSLRIFAP
jgi:hypothetical protein